MPAVPMLLPQERTRAARRNRFGQRARQRTGQAIAYALLTLGGAVMLSPFAWLVSSSLKGPEEIFLLPPEWIPPSPRWSNYSEVLSKLPFFQYLRNTLVITFGAMIGQVLTSAICAFAFARLRWPGRDLLFAVLLATIMVPYTVTLIPTFILFKTFGWLDTFLPLIVPYWFGGGPFFIFLLRQFFRTIPMELDESARLDGASSWRIFWEIVLPLAKPALAVVTVLSFLAHWNDFFGPLVYLSSADNRTLALGLAALQGLAWGRDMTHLVMAVSVIMITPIIVLFFVAQRTFIQGIVLTGIKG
ncbi:MAG: carbohydrate ABC transporter permease [Thermomicrobiales bacterium]